MEEKRGKSGYDKEEHHAFARRLAEESMVLLKNEDQILPLESSEKLAVVGEMAKHPRFQGGGSSHVNPWRLEDAWTGIYRCCPDSSYAAGYEEDRTTEELLAEAVQVAEAADKVILFIGLPELYESEGYDRTHLRLPEAHIRLLEEIQKKNDNIVTVLSNGAPVEMPWIALTKGLLEAYLPGEAGGSAVAALLFGDVNPCGKLAETFPLRLEDTPCYLDFPGDSRRVEYREGVFVGYRYYDSRNMDVLFPFGFGLSYTQFHYESMKLCHMESGDVQVKVRVTNTGGRAGKEVVQIYVKDVDSDKRRPEKELKAFEKVQLESGETKEVQLGLGRAAFAHYEAEGGEWIVRNGRFRIMAGASSRDIRFEEEITVTHQEAPTQVVTEHTPLGDMVKHPAINDRLRALLKAHPKSFEFYGYCQERDPLKQSMGALMSFHTLKRVDASLHDSHIANILKMLNEQGGYDNV